MALEDALKAARSRTELQEQMKRDEQERLTREAAAELVVQVEAAQRLMKLPGDEVLAFVRRARWFGAPDLGNGKDKWKPDQELRCWPLPPSLVNGAVPLLLLEDGRVGLITKEHEVEVRGKSRRSYSRATTHFTLATGWARQHRDHPDENRAGSNVGAIERVLAGLIVTCERLAR